LHWCFLPPHCLQKSTCFVVPDSAGNNASAIHGE
jgi:hypothetical protein